MRTRNTRSKIHYNPKVSKATKPAVKIEKDDIVICAIDVLDMVLTLGREMVKKGDQKAAISCFERALDIISGYVNKTDVDWRNVANLHASIAKIREDKAAIEHHLYAGIEAIGKLSIKSQKDHQDVCLYWLALMVQSNIHFSQKKIALQQFVENFLSLNKIDIDFFKKPEIGNIDNIVLAVYWFLKPVDEIVNKICEFATLVFYDFPFNPNKKGIFENFQKMYGFILPELKSCETLEAKKILLGLLKIIAKCYQQQCLPNQHLAAALGEMENFSSLTQMILNLEQGIKKDMLTMQNINEYLRRARVWEKVFAEKKSPRQCETQAPSLILAKHLAP